jgi:CRP-like cAMP-binding protein
MERPLQLSLATFKKGSYIIVEGKQNADFFFIIRAGTVRISKEVEVVEEEGGNILGPGDFFGVVSTMSSHSHIETAQAVTDVTLIAVHRDQFGLLIERNTPVAMKIIQGFSRKMRYLDEALTRLTFKHTAENDPSHLFTVAEYYARQSQYSHAYYAYYQYLAHCPSGPNAGTARERMEKIRPFAKPMYLEQEDSNFTRAYPRDTMIFSEGQPGKELYIIQKGSVKITKIVDNNEVLLAVLKQGDIFGEMALIENKYRSASAIAYEDSVLLAVNKANFTQMIANQPQLIARLTKLLAERLWFIYRQLANTLLTDPVGKLYDGLQLQLEKARVTIGQNETYTFDLGPRELMNMVGLPQGEGHHALQKLLTNSRIRVIDNKIFVTDTEEIVKQASYYHKMDAIARSRRQTKRAAY